MLLIHSTKSKYRDGDAKKYGHKQGRSIIIASSSSIRMYNYKVHPTVFVETEKITSYYIIPFFLPIILFSYS